MVAAAPFVRPDPCAGSDPRGRLRAAPWDVPARGIARSGHICTLCSLKWAENSLEPFLHAAAGVGLRVETGRDGPIRCQR